MSIGGGSKKEKSSGTQSSYGEDWGSEVWKAQSPYLQDLMRRGQRQLGGSYDSEVKAALFRDAAASNSYNAGTSLRQSNAALASYLKPGVDPSVGAYAKNLGQQFKEQFLPELKGQAALAGGLGGSRQQIGSALGAQRAMQTLGDFTAQVYSGQADRALAAAQAIGANSAGFQNNATQQLQTADFSRSMPWYGLQQYQGLLGSPVQIDKGGWQKSQGTTKSKGSGWDANIGWS